MVKILSKCFLLLAVVAFFLVFLTFIPMLFATVLVVFGNQIETWMVFHSSHEIGFYILTLWAFVPSTFATQISMREGRTRCFFSRPR